MQQKEIGKKVQGGNDDGGETKTKNKFKQNVYQVQLLDVRPSSQGNERVTNTHSVDAQMTFGYEAFDASGLF